jgi:hypothetical protein
MNPKTYYKKHLKTDKAKLEAVVKEAGTTMPNFQQIAIAGGSVSSSLAKALAKASDYEMTLEEILFPEENSAA